MSEPSYRPLTGEDAEAVRTLRLHVYKTNPESFSTTLEAERNVSIDVLRQVLNDYEKSGNALILGAFDAGLVGMIGLEKHVDTATAVARVRLWGLYVESDYREQGIGATLLCRALEFAASLDAVETAVLEVTAESTAAISLYERVGFKRIDREPVMASSVDTSLADLAMEYRFTSEA